MFNENIMYDDSTARICDLDIDYSLYYRGYELYAVINYEILITGNIEDYVIRPSIDDSPTFIDVHWRDLRIGGPVYIDDTEINYLSSAIKTQYPEFASMIKGSDAEALLDTSLIDIDLYRAGSLSVWYFMFYPDEFETPHGPINLDFKPFGYPVSNYAVGECGCSEFYTESDATFIVDKTYGLRIRKPDNCASFRIAGFTQIITLDGVEVIRVLPNEPVTYDLFNVTLTYVPFGLGIIGCIIFFMYYTGRQKKVKIDSSAQNYTQNALSLYLSD